MDEQKQQEMVFKFQMFEQQMQALQQQLGAVEQAIVDMNALNLGMDELVGKTGEEIFAPIGRGIFARAKLLSEDLLVDIGNKNVVKKSIPDTKKLIEAQIGKLKDVQGELRDNMNQINAEIMKVYSEMNSGCGCEENGECNCGEDEECGCEDKR